MTGLETAIILVASVVVASVFAYTLLSAGIFSAEKGKEAIYSGLGVSRNSVVISGPVTAKDTNSDGSVDQVQFILKTTGASEGVDLHITTDTDSDGLLSDEASQAHAMVISYADSRQRIEDVAWTKLGLGRGDDDDLLEDGERFLITVSLSGLTTTLRAYDSFSLEVRPDSAAATSIQRTIRAQVDPVMDLG